MTKKLTTNAGFTLIESLISILMFSIIVVLISASFTGSIKTQRRALNLQQVEENVGFMLESIAKELRVAQITGVNSACPGSPDTVLNIIHPVNGTISYYLSNNAVHRRVNGVDSVVTSNTVEFTRLYFCLSGIPVDDLKQPRVTIFGSLRSVKTKEQATVDFQTTLSQRLLSN